ncbi:MAG: MaoC family dehydratase [Beijerinckiaceae bacterium]|nr:MaoC family dehydratase [Beijerinckiaceae bacterium]
MSAVLAQGDLLAARQFGPFTAGAVAAYAQASGDDNPLHFDPAIAARAGLERPPVHGMLIMGCFEPFVGAWRPDAKIAKLSAKFIRPVLTGDTVEISGKVVRLGEDGSAVLRLTVRGENGRDIVCLAEIFIVP